MEDQVNIYSVISATASSISSSFDGETTRITSVLDDDEVDSLVATFPPSSCIATSTHDSASNYCHISTGESVVKHSLEQFTDADLVLLQLDDTDWTPQFLDESDSLLCLDLEPMAALFAFNASCNSPSYSLPHDFKPSPESKFSIHEGLLESLAPTPNSNNLRSGSCSNPCSYTPVQPHSPINHSYGGCPQVRPSYQSHPPLQPPPPPPPQYPASSISPHVHPAAYHLSPQNSYSPSPNSSSYYGTQSAGQMCYGSTANSHGGGGNINCSNQAATGQGEIISSTNTTSHFPTASVSVNLSMNMTMGFTGHHSDTQQMVQWSIPPQSQYSNNSSATNTPVNCTATTTAYQIHQFASQQSNPEPGQGASSSSSSFHHPVSMSENILTSRQVDHSLLLDKEYHHHSYHQQQQQTSQSIVTASSGNSTPRDNGPTGAIRSVAGVHSNSGTSQITNSDRMSTCQENSHKVYLRSVECSESRIESQIAQNTKQLVESNNCKSDINIGLANLCRICGKTYARPSTLKTHLRTHSGERPYRCEYCDKSFSQAANLTAHIRTHSGEKPFRCLVCDRQFSQSSSVTTHMRTHSGERPYRCRMCKKAFSDSSTLTKHLRIHSGEKPYQCRLCSLRFSQSGNLNRHMRIHSG